MKGMLLAIAVIVAVIGLFAYIVQRDPNRVQTQEALAVLHQAPGGAHAGPTLGYIDFKKYSAGKSGINDFNREYSVDMALAAIAVVPRDVVRGTLLRQEYQLRQAEYQLAQLKHLGGDISSEQLEKARTAYAAATTSLQEFMDASYRVP